VFPIFNYLCDFHPRVLPIFTGEESPGKPRAPNLRSADGGGGGVDNSKWQPD
jgi:hypothetical protein